MTVSERPQIEPHDDFDPEEDLNCGLSPDRCTDLVVESGTRATADPVLSTTGIADANRVEVQNRGSGSQDLSFFGSSDTPLASGSMNWSKFGTPVSPERASTLDVSTAEPGGAKQTLRAELVNGNLTLTQFERRVPVPGGSSGQEQVLTYNNGVLQIDGKPVIEPARIAQAMGVIDNTVALLGEGIGRDIQIPPPGTKAVVAADGDGTPLDWRTTGEPVVRTNASLASPADFRLDPYAYPGSNIPLSTEVTALQTAARGGDAAALTALQTRAGTTAADSADAVTALVNLSRGDGGTPANIRDAAHATLLNLAQNKPEARAAIFGALVGQLGQADTPPEARLQLLKTLSATSNVIDKASVNKLLTDSPTWLNSLGTGAEATRAREAYSGLIAKLAADGNPEVKAGVRQFLGSPQSATTWAALKDNPPALNKLLQSYVGSREATTPFMSAQLLDLAKSTGGDGGTQRLSRTLLLSSLGSDATAGGAGTLPAELRQGIKQHLLAFATANPVNMRELAANAMRHGPTAVDGLLSLAKETPAMGNQIVDSLLAARATANPPMAAAELAQRFQRVDGAKQHLEELAAGTGPLNQQAKEILAAMNVARPGEPQVTERRDENNNLVRETRDAQGRLQRAATYDANNRPTSVQEFNSKGQKIAQHTYRYNADGSGVVEGTDAQGKKLYSGSLDKNGKYTQLSHYKADGKTVDYVDSYTRDASGRATSVQRQNSDGTKDAFTYTYDAGGKLTSLACQRQDGTQEVHHYGANGRETRVEQTKNGQRTIWNLNNDGKITDVITVTPGAAGQPPKLQRDIYDPATGQVKGSQWIDDKGQPLANQDPPPKPNQSKYGYRTSFDEDAVDRAVFEGGPIPDGGLSRPPRLDRAPTTDAAAAPPPVPAGADPARLRELRNSGNKLLARVQRNATNANRPDFIQFTDGPRSGQVWNFQLDAEGNATALGIRNPANASQDTLVGRGPDGNWQPPNFRFPGLNEPLNATSKITPNMDGSINLSHGGRNYRLGLDGVLRPAT